MPFNLRNRSFVKLLGFTPEIAGESACLPVRRALIPGSHH